jgi:hypothetical protein
MTHIAQCHLSVIPIASRAVLGFRPAIKALHRSVLGALSAGTDGVSGHSDSNRVLLVFQPEMFTFGCVQLQIIRVVVQAVVVFVVDYFLRCQEATNLSLHNDTVLVHPFILGCVWMIRAVHLTVKRAPNAFDFGCSDWWRVLHVALPVRASDEQEAWMAYRLRRLRLQASDRSSAL